MIKIKVAKLKNMLFYLIITRFWYYIAGMRNTIKNHNDFLMADDDPTARSAFFIIRAKPAKDINDPRFGLVVTKRTFKFAVQRNLAKRKLRDWIRATGDKMLDSMDYVFIARRTILDAARDDGRAAMARALNYLAREYGKHDKKSAK